MEGLIIRAATVQDLPDILHLYAQPAIDDGVQLSPGEAEKLFAEIERHPGYGLFVAIQDGQTVGTFALMIMPNLGHLGKPSGIVESVAVAPQWQRRGIGRAMLAFAMERCRQDGCYKLTLSANRRRSSAHAFYESLGFVRHGYSFIVALGE